MRSLLVLTGLLISTSAFAEVLTLDLQQRDHNYLAKRMAKIDSQYTSEISSDDKIVKTSTFLDSSYAFQIQCAQELKAGTQEVLDSKCAVSFNLESSDATKVSLREGFMKEFILADIHDSALAGVLYHALDADRTTEERASFTSYQKVVLTSETGAKLSPFKLRMDCANPAPEKYSCSISAVK